MSEFYSRKIRTFFRRLDYDNDGSITRKDHEDMADRFIALGQLRDVQGVELKAMLVQAYERYLKDPNSDRPLDEEGAIAWFGKHFTDPALREEFRAFLNGMIAVFFKAIDSNGDGYIQSKEYEVFFEVMAIDTALAPATFAAIDTNNDGQLSLEEFVAAAVEFFTSEDESSPTQLFWGALV